MRIALIAAHLGAAPATGATAYPGEPSRRVLSLAQALAERDHEVTVYFRKVSAPGPAARCPGVRIEHIPAGPTRGLPGDELLAHIGAFAGQLTRRWRPDPPDVAHAHFWTSGLATLPAASSLGIPVAMSFHSLGDQVRPDRRRTAGGSAVRIRFEASIARSVQAVLAQTAGERSDLSLLGLPPTLIKVVPDGVDTERFRTAGPAAERGGRRRLLVVSPPGEGLAAVLYALMRLPDAELVVAGGPARSRLATDRGYRALIRLARQLGVADRLTCIGQTRESDMPPLMRSADVLVHLHPGEPFARVPVEAMACGTPVVASTASANADAVVNSNTGFLVSPGELPQLAARIRQMLESPMLLDAYSIAAAGRVLARYSWEQISRETLAVYETLPGRVTDAAA